MHIIIIPPLLFSMTTQMLILLSNGDGTVTRIHLDICALNKNCTS